MPFAYRPSAHCRYEFGFDVVQSKGPVDRPLNCVTTVTASVSSVVVPAVLRVADVHPAPIGHPLDTRIVTVSVTAVVRPRRSQRDGTGTQTPGPPASTAPARPSAACPSASPDASACPSTSAEPKLLCRPTCVPARPFLFFRDQRNPFFQGQQSPCGRHQNERRQNAGQRNRPCAYHRRQIHPCGHHRRQIRGVLQPRLKERISR